jgi:hypothetical protein
MPPGPPQAKKDAPTSEWTKQEEFEESRGQQQD